METGQCGPFDMRFCIDWVMWLVRFLNFCEAGKTPAAQRDLSCVAEDGSPFARDFLAAEKKFHGFIGQRNRWGMDQVRPDANRQTSK